LASVAEEAAERDCDCPPEWQRCELCRISGAANRAQRRIDAALAEPVVECARCETLRDLADKAAWAQGDAQRRMIRAQTQRDEARAEVRRTYIELSEVISRNAEAYQRGAEAMREAAASYIENIEPRKFFLSILPIDVRDLPLPEEK
jgi:hypothetical protein